MRSSSISLVRYGSEIRKVNRCRLAVSNETVLVTRQGVFFAKVTPVQSITDIVFWLMLLSWIFTLSYTTIYFSEGNFFFECLHFSKYNIGMSLYFFGWERGHQLSTYATVWGTGIIQIVYSCVQREVESRLMRTYALAHLFSYFWQYFCLIVPCFYCRNLTLLLFKKDVFDTNSYLSLTSSWHQPFSLKVNFVIKVIQNPFNFSQIES